MVIWSFVLERRVGTVALKMDAPTLREACRLESVGQMPQDTGWIATVTV